MSENEKKNKIEMDENYNNFFNKALRITKNLIWKLPFENYDKYYSNGIIHKMSQQEKLEFTINQHKKTQEKKLLLRLVKLRPNILDDNDLIQFNHVNEKSKFHLQILFTCLFLNTTYAGWLIHKKQKLFNKYFVMITFSIIASYGYISSYQSKLNNYIYDKYKDIFKNDETRDVFLRLGGIN